ncbi:MAG: hypothetical protein WC222_07225 [Parachlamydiales bacterium]|jgi:hypothetical protein
MSFAPPLTSIVPKVGINFILAFSSTVALEVLPKGRTKTTLENIVDRVFLCTSAILAGCTALAIIGSGGAGYAALGVFTAAGILTLGKDFNSDNSLLKKWSHYANKYEVPIGVVSSIVNVCGGAYTLITLPFKWTNLGGTLSAAFSFLIFSKT